MPFVESTLEVAHVSSVESISSDFGQFSSYAFKRFDFKMIWTGGIFCTYRIDVRRIIVWMHISAS